MDYKRVDLLVSVARLYYEHNYSQSMIADKLNLSRPYISKLIAQAREEGIVTIQINDPAHTETPLEREIRQRFALRKVIVVPMSMDVTPLAKIGAVCARFLDTIVSSGDIIGVSWGGTMFSCAQNAISRQDLNNIIVVQLCGGTSNIERSIYASEIPKLFADAYSGVPYILPLPAIVDNIHVKQSMLTDRGVNQVMEYGIKSNIALFTLGQFGEDNALIHAGYLSGYPLKKLNKSEAVGDICSHFIDENGQLCDEELDSRTIGISLEELKKKDYRIAVAEGQKKVRSICGALNGGHINVLITDEDTAQSVLKRLDENSSEKS